MRLALTRWAAWEADDAEAPPDVWGEEGAPSGGVPLLFSPESNANGTAIFGISMCLTGFPLLGRCPIGGTYADER